MSDVAETLGRIVEDSEAAFFVGRQAELAVLRQAFADARDRPVAVYMYGPPGVGKSALLRVFARELQQRQAPVVTIDGSKGERTRVHLRDTLAAQLHVPVDGGEVVDGLVRALNAGARAGGAALVIDGYDDLLESDGWLRNELFWHLAAGVCIVLAGRLRPVQLWSGALGWTKAVRSLRVGDLEVADVVAFLAHCGITDEAVGHEVYEVTCGRPQLVCMAANALLMQPPLPGSRGQWTYGRRDLDRLAPFLVEHILHPGSRRRSWRAGVGASQMDNVVAAAAVLPSFDRVELASLVGRDAVARAWPSLLTMATPDETSGRYALSETLRRRVAATVVRQRPWAERKWRRAALRQCLSHAREGFLGGDGALHWLKVAHIARETPWWDWVNPAGEVDGLWRVRRDVRHEDLAKLAEISGGTLGLDTISALRDAAPETIIVARDRTGDPVGFMTSIPASHRTLPVLRGLPPFGHPNGTSSLPTLMPEDGTVVWAHVAGATQGVEGALVREAMCDAVRCRRVLALGPNRWTGAGSPLAVAHLGELGFVNIGSRHPDLWQLDLDDIGHEEWLSRLIRPRADIVIPDRDWSESVKEALTLLDDPDQLGQTAVAKYYAALSGDGRTSGVRAWLLDALATAELDDTPPSERVVLTLYYVDRLGPHEVVAERMNLPRTTYFRCHRRALVHLAENLFVM